MAVAIAGVCGFSRAARGIVIPVAELYSTSVPANGVLRFSIQDGVTVQILAADGSEVPGSFVAHGVWRPDEPFALGTFTADLSWPEHPSWALDATFEVTPAVDPSSELVHVVVTPRVDADGTRVLEQECCLAGESRPPEPCTGACPPLCVGTVYAAKPVVLVSSVPINDAIDWQVEVREVAPTEEGEFTLGYAEVTGSPDQLCGVVEVFSWLDESTTVVADCIINPKPELTPVQYPVEGFGTTSECTIPPPGYEVLWCDERRYICQEWILTPEGAQHEETMRACEHYGEVCGGSEGVETSGGESSSSASTILDAGSGAGHTGGVGDPTPETDDTSRGGDDGEPILRGLESSKGCTIVVRRAPDGVLQALLTAGFVGIVVTTWRRRRQ